MHIIIDIETIPDQRPGAKERFIEESVNNFKAPSSLTKTQAAKDLGLTDAKEIKFTSADDMKERWVKEMAPTMAEEVGIENWKKTSFDGAQGQVFSWAYKGLGDDDCYHDYNLNDERQLLISLRDSLLETLDLNSHKTKPYFIGHYIEYDLKFLLQRFIVHKIKPGFKLSFPGRHDKDYFDNMIAWCGYKDTISQDNLCKALGVKGKPDDIDGSKVWEFVEAGKHKEVMEYNIDDVEKAEMVYKRLNFL